MWIARRGFSVDFYEVEPFHIVEEGQLVFPCEDLWICYDSFEELFGPIRPGQKIKGELSCTESPDGIWVSRDPDPKREFVDIWPNCEPELRDDGWSGLQVEKSFLAEDFERIFGIVVGLGIKVCLKFKLERVICG